MFILTKAAYIPTSFVGDTIVNLAVCRALVKEKGYSKIYIPFLYDIYDLTVKHLISSDDRKWLYPVVDDELTNKLSDPVPYVKERFVDGQMVAYYDWTAPTIYGFRLKKIEEFAKFLFLQGVTDLYVGHWFYGMMHLSRICKEKYGMRITGFFPAGDSVRYVTDERMIPSDSGLRHEGFLGNKLSKWFVGRNLRTDEFYIRTPKVEQEDYVLVMPSSRSKFLTAGHWDLDIQVLQWMGHRVKVAIWEKDLTEELYTSLGRAWAEGQKPDIIILEDFGDTLKAIKGSKLLVTNDSGQFHAAWIMGKKCIVKTKDLIHDKWIPFHLHKEDIVILPAQRFFPSDYVEMMKGAIENCLLEENEIT